MNFTPPTPPAVPEWATYLPARRPLFKTHKNIGHAKNAFNSWSGALQPGILYHLVAGEYVEYTRVEQRMFKVDHPVWAEREQKKREAALADEARREAWRHDSIHKTKRFEFCPSCGERLR